MSHCDLKIEKLFHENTSECKLYIRIIYTSVIVNEMFMLKIMHVEVNLKFTQGFLAQSF